MGVIRRIKKRLKGVCFKTINRYLYRLPVIVDLRGTSINENPRDLMPINSNYDKKNIFFLFQIPVERIMNYRILKVWVEVLKIWGQESASMPVDERDSFQRFKSFFVNYQPKSVAEFFNYSFHNLSSEQENYFSLPPIYAVFPWVELSPQEIFAKRYRIMENEHRHYNEGKYCLSDGFKTYGPASERLIKYEYSRLTSIYDSLRKQGFVEEYGYPTVKLYIKGNEFMVSPMHGWHRIAAMIALGYKDVPFLIRLGKDNITRREDNENWHNVKSGLYTEEQALELFDRLFFPLVSTLE